MGDCSIAQSGSPGRYVPGGSSLHPRVRLVGPPGTPDDIKQEVKRCADDGRDAPRFFFRCIGDLPHNVPLENIKTYFQALKDYGRR